MNHPTSTAPPPEDIRIERARLALTDYAGADLGGMSIGDAAGWLGRFSVVLENLLECAEQLTAQVRGGAR